MHHPPTPLHARVSTVAVIFDSGAVAHGDFIHQALVDRDPSTVVAATFVYAAEGDPLRRVAAVTRIGHGDEARYLATSTGANNPSGRPATLGSGFGFGGAVAAVYDHIEHYFDTRRPMVSS